MSWLQDYQYRKKVTIKGESGAGSNYQVKLEIGHSSGGDFTLNGHCTDFPNDIRFTDNDEESLLDYWIENEGVDPITVWIEVTDSLESNVDIYVYYGKTSETSNSNGVNTFQFFDDFPGTSLDTANKWTEEGTPSIVVANSILTLSCNAAFEDIKSKNFTANGYNSSIAIRTRLKYSGTVPTEFGFGDYTWPVTSHCALSVLWTANEYELLIENGATREFGGGHTMAIDDYYIREITWTSLAVKLFKESVEKTSLTTVHPNDDLSVKLGNPTVDTTARTGYFDWVLVRKFVATEPSFNSAGNEEEKLVSSIVHEFQIIPIFECDNKLNNTHLGGGAIDCSLIIESLIKKNYTYLEGTIIDISPDISMNYFQYTITSLSQILDFSHDLFGDIQLSLALNTILDVAHTLSPTTFRYGIQNEDNILTEFIGNREFTHVIGPSDVGNLLSYRVTQEWQAPYDIAELRYKGIPSFELGDYIQIEQKDYIVMDQSNPPYKIQWVIFRGPAIGIDKTYKKNFEVTTVKAVSNEWYLTKQFCFWEEKWTNQLSLLKDVNGRDYVKFFLGGMHSWSNFTDKHGLGEHWEWITGIYPMSLDTITDWESIWEARSAVFSYPFMKRKDDAIRDLCHHCDYAFYCVYGHDSWNWGRRDAHFKKRSNVESANWPFGSLWRININADDGGGFSDRLLEIRSRETQTTDDTRINRVAMGASISIGDYPMVRREQAGAGTREEEIKPVEVYQGIKTNQWADLNANSSELYTTLRRTNVTYEAKMLSLVSTYNPPSGHYETPMCPGMQIKFTNVNGHPEDIFRIKKITHERGSGDPVAITTIQYQDFDLIRGGSPKLNEIESIFNSEESKMEKGDKILGYPAKDPRSISVGEKTGIDVGEVVDYNVSENTVDVKIYSTNQIVKGVPVV